MTICCSLKGKVIEWDVRVTGAQADRLTRTGIVEKVYGDSIVVYELETGNPHRLDWLGPLLEIRLIGGIQTVAEEAQTETEKAAARARAWRQHQLLNVAKLELVQPAVRASLLR